ATHAAKNARLRDAASRVTPLGQLDRLAHAGRLRRELLRDARGGAREERLETLGKRRSDRDHVLERERLDVEGTHYGLVAVIAYRCLGQAKHAGAVYTQIRRIREWLAHRIGTAAALVRRLPTPGSVRLIWEAGDYPLGEVAGGQGGALASTPLGGTAGERNLPGGAFVDVR